MNTLRSVQLDLTVLPDSHASLRSFRSSVRSHRHRPVDNVDAKASVDKKEEADDSEEAGPRGWALTLPVAAGFRSAACAFGSRIPSLQRHSAQVADHSSTASLGARCEQV